MFFAVGIEGFMAESLTDGSPAVEKGMSGSTEIEGGKALPDIADGLIRGMEHVSLIEAIVAQFVVHYLIGREIAAAVVFITEFVGSQKQCRLG